VLGEAEALEDQAVTRVVLCAGKVYYDLLERRRADERRDVAILRLEQLNPFPREALEGELRRYGKAKELVWCQEEPENQGAWRFVQEQLRGVLPLQYAGRPAYASPAEGSLSKHLAVQAELVTTALGKVLKSMRIA
jgi:2-oxoglutarate dehydrogenase E1 component